MEYVKLGHTGLEVSRICLGCMSYGQSDSGVMKWAWTLSEEDSRPYIKTALEHGINFFDTANVYSHGESERVLGRALRDFAKRDEVVIATKVYSPMRLGPNGKGLSRKAILSEIDDSLKRLGTDYVDLYIIHRYDYETPLEETLEALDEVVRSGKALYLGASSMYAWQFMKAIGLQRANGWAQFISMQNYYNLMYREEEREMLPLCKSEGIGVTPWSPLARGRLTRPWQNEPQTERAKNDALGDRLYEKSKKLDKPVVDRVLEVAKARGVSPAQVALAWMLSKPAVTSPIIGATKPHQLDDAIKAVSLKLSDEEIAHLEDLYEPHHAPEGYV
ncbi:aldo/keto reductase [Hyphomicrobium sp. 99]|uniref:aldo/keto reductase n=1 Tax=Hyphomicrobium sp. 99 TaxID=1163419 RepID=UPI0005F7D449|nr:aldo/keto reductase [Hyphomicrobium sp. 99]